MKLLANAVNALGVALMIGSLVAPFVDPTRNVSQPRSALGVTVGAILVFAAFTLLLYIEEEGVTMDPFLQSGITLVVGLATLAILVAFVTPLFDRLAGGRRLPPSSK